MHRIFALCQVEIEIVITEVGLLRTGQCRQQAHGEDGKGVLNVHRYHVWDWTEIELAHSLVIAMRCGVSKFAEMSCLPEVCCGLDL